MINLPDNDFYQVPVEETGLNNPIIIDNGNLPIHRCKAEIIEAVRKNQFVIIHGETGCGKTTQVPQYLYEASLNEDLIIGVTQPRRLAAETVANRVAEEMKVPLGKTVGYEVRFNKKTDSATKIKYMTDGILLNECISDKRLNEYKIIIIDEAHERSVISDLLLGLLKRIATTREDLKVIISSATIHVDKFVEYFVNARIVTIPTRLYPVTVNYESYHKDYITKTVMVCDVIHQSQSNLAGQRDKGDILVFLTGQDEIFQCCEELEKVKDIVAIPLCSAIDTESQQKAFKPVKPFETKVVVATNIAETSLTIEGIKFVIDCGYVKQNRYNPRRGMEILEDVRISKSQAEQRKGRAGRTRPGICHRLYDKQAYDEMPDEASPEIYRKNLSAIYLTLRALNLEPEQFEFLDKPKLEELERSKLELIDLDLMKPDGTLTEIGQQISELPVGPVLGKVLLTSFQYQCTMDIIKIVAMFSEKIQNIFRRPRNNVKKAEAKKHRFYDSGGDHFTLLNVYNEWLKEKRDRRKWCFKNFINADAMENVASVINQIRYILTKKGLLVGEDRESASGLVDIKKCFVAGYFKNICVKQLRDNYCRCFDEEMFSIFGNSSIKNDRPKIILFNDAWKTSRRFASGVMQLDELFLRDNFAKELELINFPADINKPLSF